MSSHWKFQWAKNISSRTHGWPETFPNLPERRTQLRSVLLLGAGKGTRQQWRASRVTSVPASPGRRCQNMEHARVHQTLSNYLHTLTPFVSSSQRDTVNLPESLPLHATCDELSALCPPGSQGDTSVLHRGVARTSHQGIKLAFPSPPRSQHHQFSNLVRLQTG